MIRCDESIRLMVMDTVMVMSIVMALGELFIHIKNRKHQLTLSRGRLNGNRDDLAVLDDDGASLQSGTTEDGRGVEDETELGGEGGVVIGD